MRSLRCSCVSCDPSALLASPTELLSATAFDVSSVHSLCLRVRHLEETLVVLSLKGSGEVSECVELLDCLRHRFEVLEKLGKGKG